MQFRTNWLIIQKQEVKISGGLYVKIAISNKIFFVLSFPESNGLNESIRPNSSAAYHLAFLSFQGFLAALLF